jgi:hypothetical protein
MKPDDSRFVDLNPRDRPPRRTNLWLDPKDIITDVDAPWLEFARVNDAKELTREAVVGRPLTQFIDGHEVKALTDLLLTAARRGGLGLSVPFRCDSPGERRFMTMTLHARAWGAVHLEYVLDRAEPRADVLLLDRRSGRSEAFVYVCSWCGHVRLADGWVDVERAIAEADLFGRGARTPKISHGICDECAATLKTSMVTEGL